MTQATASETARQVLCDVITPAYALLPAAMQSENATVMLLAIGLQESRLTYRSQIGGPAKGLWQFERGGGVRGVLTHDSSKSFAEQLCRWRSVEPTADAVYAALESDDVLAAGFARLLLWTHPAPLPAITSQFEAWKYYLRTWRPGKPHPETWPNLHEIAREVTCEHA